MVARIFRPECLCWLSALGQRHSRLARHRDHPRCFEIVGYHVDLRFVENRMGDQTGRPSMYIIRKEISNVIHGHCSTNRIVFDRLLAIKPLNYDIHLN